jgi:hypothetical protein
VLGPQKHGRATRGLPLSSAMNGQFLFFIHLNKFYILNCPFFNGLSKLRLQTLFIYTQWKRKKHLLTLPYQGKDIIFRLVGTHDLRTLRSPLVSLNRERHTQRRKAANFIFYFFMVKFVEKSPMKTYMVKRVFWKIFKTKIKSTYFQEGKKKGLKLPHFEKEKNRF